MYAECQNKRMFCSVQYCPRVHITQTHISKEITTSSHDLISTKTRM